MFEVARLGHPKDVYGFARLNALQTAAQPKGPLSYRAVRLYQARAPALGEVDQVDVLFLTISRYFKYPIMNYMKEARG